MCASVCMTPCVLCVCVCRWKDAISSKDYWSQAMPVVLQFWHEHVSEEH